jgi:NAD/NADP transhydrogenase beta subunit
VLHVVQRRDEDGEVLRQAKALAEAGVVVTDGEFLARVVCGAISRQLIDVISHANAGADSSGGATQKEERSRYSGASTNACV